MVTNYSVNLIILFFVLLSDQENDGIDMDEFEPLPSIEEAALMAAGIHRDDVPQGENLAILPHKLPRPVVMPPTPPPAVEPFYQPVDGKPVGK